ncbi:MAG: hypothetical protein A2Y64_02225 [Candidatus Coatesbacteria bacterium RBG_13_66_14]|uniref:Uncharacterized protein n=1 Tax=Candidatus Coatesbacteria bacterium RBG_13_66_14 TaxID=1817816 RepID=A0A1F5EVZ0_9BACT|nr:MAG: hypothetical protein A2Y64_02225 [Candidatus Coatesbacteria bacterium RBG_13_66_14]
MRALALVGVILALSTAAGSADVQLLFAGADGEELAALTEAWPEAGLLPPDVPWDAPYPELLPLLVGDVPTLIIAVNAGPSGLAVSGRLLGRGGYDERLGTVHIAASRSSLLEAARQFLARVGTSSGSTTTATPGEVPTPGAGEIAGKLEKISGWGVAPAGGITDDESRRRTRLRAYDAAEADFLDRLEDTLYPKTLLDVASYRQVVALVRGYLFVSREERRTGDETYGIELRLTPEGIRRLTGLLFTRLGAP